MNTIKRIIGITKGILTSKITWVVLIAITSAALSGLFFSEYFWVNPVLIQTRNPIVKRTSAQEYAQREAQMIQQASEWINDYTNNVEVQTIFKKDVRKNMDVTPTPTAEPKFINRRPTDEFVADLVRSYPWDYSTAIRLAKSENFYNLTGSFDCARTNVNSDGSVDVGLFQINSIHSRRLASLGMTMEDMKDCRKNADYAYNWIYKSSGWSPWSAYTNGSYINHSVI